MRLILITSASYYRVSGGGELINASTGFLHRLTTVTFSVHSHGGWRLHKCTHLHACVADPNLLLRYGLDSPVLPFAPTREREGGRGGYREGVGGHGVRMQHGAAQCA
jgi:hypothetical protein